MTFQRDDDRYPPRERRTDDDDRYPPRERRDDRDWDEPRMRPRVGRGTIRKFREQIHALGALWIILGGLTAGVAVLALQGSAFWGKNLGANPEFFQLIIGVIGAVGALWFTLGILTCMKQLWAVYVGLILSYLSLIGQVVNLSVCGIIILIVVILQAHRVIGWANQMNAEGVPLNAKPD